MKHRMETQCDCFMTVLVLLENGKKIETLLQDSSINICQSEFFVYNWHIQQERGHQKPCH